MHSNRPSDRELDKKLKGAKAALSTQDGLYANINKAVGELYELDIESPRKVWKLIIELLDEIRPENYSGGRPPQKSYEKAIEGSELFAFSWDSKKLSRRMYIKFALKGDRYYYLSLHKSKEQL